MLTLRRIGWGAALTAIVLALGCTGADGKDGANGEPGSKGDPGVVPPLKNDLSGVVTDSNTMPLPGVTVTASPTSAKPVTTDGNGAFSFTSLDVGGYDLTFHLDGYVDQTVAAAVNLSGPTKVKVVLAVDVDKAPAPAVAVTDQLNVGYN